MNLIEIASQMFMDKVPGGAAGQLNMDSVKSALQGLFPTNGEELDIASLVSKFTSQGGLGALAASWLGDGGNMSVSAEQLIGLFGQGKIADFASNLGIDQGAATSGLTDMIPDLIDKASSGGALKSDLASSLVSGLAGKLFGR